MNLAYISHHDCQLHQMGAHHVEVPERLHAISDRMIASGIEMLVTHYDAPKATANNCCACTTPTTST
jgi:acetoin utilization deacetylase AcuC-like enzyme